MAKAVIFDIRDATERDPRFLWASQALHETSMLAYAAQSPLLSSMSIAIIGSKGFEILASILPINDLNFSFQKIITKLKQQLKIPPSNAIYPHRGSFNYLLSEMLSQFEDKELVGIQTQLKELCFTILTKSAKHKLNEEINAFLQKSNYSKLANINFKVEVISLSSSGLFTHQPLETAMFHDKVVWKVVNQESDIFRYFKSWLKMKREGWQMKAADNHDWTVTVDIEDATIDSARARQSSNNSTEQNKANATTALFSATDPSCMQMTEYIRSDALPALYLVGIGRYVTPSENPTNGVDANKARFYALVHHLRKESWIAMARLVPPSKGTDLFVLMPSSGGEKLLMRNLVPRELILPFPNVSLTPEDNLNEEEFDAISREQCRIKAVQAFESLPVLTQLPSDEKSILKAVAKKLQDEALFALGAGSKTVTPLKMRKANVKFSCQ